MKQKLICVNTSTMAFDNHQVDLQGDDINVSIRYKKMEHFDSIKKGDEVTVSISETPASVAKDKKKTAKKAPQKRKLWRQHQRRK